MANQRHVDMLLRDGVRVWNAWRREEPKIRPDLSKADLAGADHREAELAGADLREAALIGAQLNGANLSEAHLSGANLRDADLTGADLTGANLTGANLTGANLTGAVLNRARLVGMDLTGVRLRGASLSRVVLTGADLTGVHLSQAHLNGADLSEAHLAGAGLAGANLTWASLAESDLTQADLREADLREADLSEAHLSEADLSEANLTGADLSGANLTQADLSGARLTQANLSGADLSEANLTGADLTRAICIGTNISGATLTGCAVYGISAWDLHLDDATNQTNLRITPFRQPSITVDNLEVAQFLYLLLSNPKIRDVIDTLTSKVVLILGRFTPERKAVLDTLRGALRERGYVPVLFDFAGPENRDTTETVTLLARMARFVIADLTDPSSLPLELQAFVPDVQVPVQCLILEGQQPFAMFGDLRRKYSWVLPPVSYATSEELLASLSEMVIAPVEQHVAPRRLANADNK